MTTNARAPENNIGVRKPDGWEETTTEFGTWRLEHAASGALLELMPDATRSPDRDCVEWSIIYRDETNASGLRINQHIIGDKDIAKRRAREWAAEHTDGSAPAETFDSWGMLR